MEDQREIESVLEASGWFLDGISEKSEATYYTNAKYASRVRVASHDSYHACSASCIQLRFDGHKIRVGCYVFDTIQSAVDEINDYAGDHTFRCNECGSLHEDEEDAANNCCY